MKRTLTLIAALIALRNTFAMLYSCDNIIKGYAMGLNEI